MCGVRHYGLQGYDAMTTRNTPSLATFTPDEAELFFGRQTICQTLLQKIQNIWEQDYQVLSLIGAADTGKTSLIQAGLIPLLTHSSEYWKILNINCENTDTPELLTQAIEITNTTKINKPTQHLLILDNLEILFQHSYDPQQQIELIKLIQTLSKIENTAILIILDEAYLKIAKTCTTLTKLWEHSHYIELDPINQSECLEILQKTAEFNQLSFEIDDKNNSSLDQDIAKVANGYKLSELNYLLQKLYEKDHKKGTLSYQSYQELGGIQALSQQFKRLWLRYPANIHVSCRSFINKLSVDSPQAPIRIHCPISKLRQTPRQRNLFADMQKYGLLKPDTNKQIRLNYPIFSALQHCAISQDKPESQPTPTALKDPKISTALSQEVSAPMPDLSPQKNTSQCDSVAEEVHQGMRLLVLSFRFLIALILIIFAWGIWVNYIKEHEPMPINVVIERNTKQDQVVASERLQVSDMPRVKTAVPSLAELNKPANISDNKLFNQQDRSSNYYLNTIEEYKIQQQKTPTLLIEKALMENYTELAKAHQREQNNEYAHMAYRNASTHANSVLRQKTNASTLATAAEIQEALGDLSKQENDIQEAWQAYQNAFRLRQSQWQYGVTPELQQAIAHLKQKMLHINQ